MYVLIPTTFTQTDSLGARRSKQPLTEPAMPLGDHGYDNWNDQLVLELEELC